MIVENNVINLDKTKCECCGEPTKDKELKQVDDQFRCRSFKICPTCWKKHLKKLSGWNAGYTLDV